MDTKNITESLLSNSENIEKCTNIKAILISAITVAAGVVALLSIRGGRHAASVDMFMLLAGIAVIGFGIIYLARNHKKVIYKPTKCSIETKEVHFDGFARKKLIDILENGKFNFSDVKRYHSGSIRLDLMRSADGSFTAAQIFEFIPYSYTPVTEIYSFDKDNGNELWNSVNPE
ncbi:MAG: hypothetical protein RR293_08185 [Bacteroidales bacterium]